AGKDPISYLHGHCNVIPGLEKAMEGKEVGAEFEVTVRSAEAYGDRHEDRTQEVPVKHLQGGNRWKPGMIAMVQTDQGMRQVSIIKACLKRALVDLNHPL
ncbi:FKBP-type peptidyl-prolyl cis-trans isomerase, partial [Marinomonas arenicola]|uniref:FKBP-type peptidyl-prolyl cis-trans isomerase n=1 Tax=Marinomonas arenicola TaxID=569601 RepID=UPI00311F7A3F